MNLSKQPHKKARASLAGVALLVLFAGSHWLANAQEQGQFAQIGEALPISKASFEDADRAGQPSGFSLPPATTPYQFWAGADLLMWHMSHFPLGDAGGTGFGGRFSSGLSLDPEQRFGIETSGLTLSQSSASGSSYNLFDRPWEAHPPGGVDHLFMPPVYNMGNNERQNPFGVPLEGGHFSTVMPGAHLPSTGRETQK